MAAAPPSPPRSSVFPRSFGDWAPLLVGGIVILALALGIFDKYVLGNGRFAPTPVPAVETTVSPVSPPTPTPASVSGRVGSLRVVASRQLPTRPGVLRIDRNCASSELGPISPPAVLSAKAGWRVLSEQALAGYQLVMVDAGSESQPDGQCVPIGTSVLVFRETNLVAIAYSRNTPNAVRLTSMTHLGGDEIRLDGIGGPAARLVLTSKTIHLMPIP
jgi:hypothetical protein